MKGWVGPVGWPTVDGLPTFSCRSSAGQGKFAGQRPTFYHCATQPTEDARVWRQCCCWEKTSNWLIQKMLWINEYLLHHLFFNFFFLLNFFVILIFLLLQTYTKHALLSTWYTNGNWLKWQQTQTRNQYASPPRQCNPFSDSEEILRHWGILRSVPLVKFQRCRYRNVNCQNL